MPTTPKPPIRRPLTATFAAVFTALASLHVAAPVRADGDRAALRVPMLPKYQQECAACHLAYPPGLLPAASWQRLMRNLPQHFGTDASLDAATVKEIGQWLQAHAADPRRSKAGAAAPPEDRITRSAWFLREHREITPATWARPAIKSAAHCAACHTRADQGDFDERHIRIPR
jgi:mono/diheme cytochrome c family protein